VVISTLTLYIVSALLLSIIPSGKSPAIEPETGIPIWIESNGVHTDLILPVKSAVVDWSNYFPFSNTVAKDTQKNVIAIGWGDKGFYLETPTWGDLKPSTACKAAFGLSSTALHTTYYRKIQENDHCVKVHISRPQYQQLVSYILGSIPTNPEGKPILIPTNMVYGKSDAFYEAKGSYILFQTCNTWTNSALKSAGLPASAWTPFDRGILYHYGKDFW
jgi:uncharacterized protein (TIGR02117 family)